MLRYAMQEASARLVRRGEAARGARAEVRRDRRPGAALAARAAQRDTPRHMCIAGALAVHAMLVHKKVVMHKKMMHKKMAPPLACGLP